MLKEEKVFKGLPLSEGIAIGHPLFFLEKKNKKSDVSIKDVKKEILRYRQAISCSKLEIENLQKRFTKQEASAVVDILSSHREMLDDPILTTSIEDKIKTLKKNTEYVFQVLIEEYKVRFSKVTDPFFQEKIKDVLDVSQRVLKHLNPTFKTEINNVERDSVILTEELVPSDIAEADNNRINAFVTQSGGHSSHSAIIARAKNIPYVAKLDISLLKKTKTKLIIVDGINGEVIVNPKNSTLEKYEKLKRELEEYYVILQKEAFLLVKSQDDVKIKISANIGGLGEIDLLKKNQASSVGIFRTEYLFLAEKEMPSEERQFNIYKKLAEQLSNIPITIRIFDIGADKNYLFSSDEKYLDFYHETNPSLGCRGVRFLLKHPNILKDQLRAILRANKYGNIQILVPLVTDISEFLEIKNWIRIVQKELVDDGHEIIKDIKVGCMMEVPAAVLMSDHFAKEADFLSIGTNDLTQYTMATDCNNSAISHLYNPIHPSMLKMLSMIISSAKKYERPAILCGEMAADIRYTQLLLGLGFRELSMAPRNIPIIKHIIREISIKNADKLAKKAIEIFDTEKLERLLLESNPI